MDTKGILDLDKTTNTLFINPIGKLFSDSIHQISMAVCSNPTCNCGQVNMIIETGSTEDDDEQVEYKIPIDIHKEIIDRSSDDEFYFREQDKEYVIDLLSDSISKFDWYKLRGLHYNYKRFYIDEVDPNKIDYQFKENDLMDRSLHFSYHEIFPSSRFYIPLGDNQHLALDDYCKNPTCACTEAFIRILKIGEANSSENIGGFWYNYKTKKADFEGEDIPLLIQLFNRLIEIENNFGEVLETRSKNMKIIYQKAYEKYAPLYNKPKLQLMKIGRNDLCSCGSGKKYKRCCMNK